MGGLVRRKHEQDVVSPECGSEGAGGIWVTPGVLALVTGSTGRTGEGATHWRGTWGEDTGFSSRYADFEMLVGYPDGLVREAGRYEILGSSSR